MTVSVKAIVYFTADDDEHATLVERQIQALLPGDQIALVEEWRQDPLRSV